MSITYNVLYRIHGDTTWITFGNTSLTTVTVTGLNPSTLYDFEVQAVNEAGTSTSNIVQTSTLGGLTINSVTLSNQSFTAGSPIGTQVGTISVGMSSGTFVGSLSLGGTDAASFQIVGNALQLRVANTTARTYSINIVATQTSPVVDNSPFTQTFSSITGSASTTESAEGFSVTAPGTSIQASTTMGSAQAVGPWDKWDLTAGQQITLLHPGQSLITTTSGGVVKLVYSNHTIYQQNNATPAGWWYWNTAAAFGPSNWVEFGVSTLTVTTQTYAANAAINTQVATLSVTMLNSPAFSGSYTVTDPTDSFKIVGNAVQAKKILSASSYPSVTVTAIPRISTDGSATHIGEEASQTVTITQTGAATQLVTLGIHINTTFNTASSSNYANDAAHWTGVVNGFGRTPTLIGAVGTNTAFSPTTWPAIAQYNIDNWPSTAPTNLAVLLHWAWEDTGGPNYSMVVNDTTYGGTPISGWVNQSLDVYRNNGRTRVYIRPNWEWNLNGPGNNGWGITSGTVATFLAAWRRFSNTVHQYNIDHPGFIAKMVWGPSVPGGQGVGTDGVTTNGLTLAQQFPSPDGSAISGKYVDVVGPDPYSFGSNLVSAVNGDNRNFFFTTCVALAVANGCTVAASEIGGTVNSGGGSPAAWIADAVSYFRTLALTTPIEYLCFWDVMTPPGQLEFTHPSSLNYPISLNGWKAGVTAGGATPIMTLPPP